MGFSAVNSKEARPKIKYHVIYRHREQYSAPTMCRFFSVSRSGCYDFVKRLEQPDRNAALVKKIWRQEGHSDNTYGYGRMWKWLQDKRICRIPKTILKVMKECGLLSEIRRKRKWVNLGKEAHKYKNLLNLQFHANEPNRKWGTDISHIQTKEVGLYLSMIRDLYDNGIVAYKTAAHQTVNLVLDTIRLAIKTRKKKIAAELHLHSEQGFQYTSHAYFKLTQEYSITPSMSGRGNPYDNALAENFFGILKSDFIYRHKPRTLVEADERMDRYIPRIQLKAGVVPQTLRHSAKNFIFPY